MLVLSRKRGEEIQIGECVKVVVIDISPNKIRLGIIAPPEVPVHRKEVFDALPKGQAQLDRRQEHEGNGNGNLLHRAEAARTE